ncbi:hypothetical protein ACH4F6_37915 [Streptomyces sp. NPDC017936]|uniref:hypothetical protein n=1 Tax=Streptomyces sp. NPDC017936 TaxID=3365016 RepID=UPI0037A88A98
MRTIWTQWDTADMTDAAEMENRAALRALGVPERRLLEVLPYYGAFTDYHVHVTACAACRDDDRADCPEGRTLLDVSWIGVEEQHRSALSN